MPPIRTARNRKPPPAGFDDIEDTLLEFSNKMKDAENASHEGKKKHEVLWPIFQISHQRTSSRSRSARTDGTIVLSVLAWSVILILASMLTFFVVGTGSRYIYDLYYEKEAISKQLYDWLLKNNYADANLIAKWKKQGYEKVSKHLLLSSLLFLLLLSCSSIQLTSPPSSSAVSAASKPKKQTSTQPVSAACPKPN